MPIARPSDQAMAGNHEPTARSYRPSDIVDGLPPDDEDLLTLLREDHQRVRKLLTLVASADPLEQPAIVRRLAAVLSGHEAAEELVLYPIVRDEVSGGAAMVAAATVAQADLTELVVGLESVAWWDADAFVQAHEDLSRAVSDHFSWEETTVFPCVQQQLVPYRRFMMGARYLEVNSAGPTLAARALRRGMKPARARV